MMEESGNRSVLVTDRSGCRSGRPPNTTVNIIITMDSRGKHFATDKGRESNQKIVYTSCVPYVC
jgi:hypothetical protein